MLLACPPPAPHVDFTWRRVLLEEPVKPQLRESLPGFLRQVAQDFLEDVRPHLDAADDAELDHWYASAAGQAALCSFTLALWEQMSQFSTHAMPTHDARHAMLKVPASALEYMASEDVHGWRRIGVVAALLHDHGRWAEERLWGYPQQGPLHARLSFLLGKELLDTMDLPEAAKEQILLAVLVHTAGADIEDPMPLKLVVAADRDQLYGPEIVLRILHHAVNERGDMANIYGGPGVSVLDRLSHFLHHRLPGPLTSGGREADRLWDVLATFLLKCETLEESNRRFLGGDKPVLRPGFNCAQAWQRAAQLGPRETDALAAAASLLDAPLLAQSSYYRQQALAKVFAAPEERKTALASALAYVACERRAEDRRQAGVLARIARANADDRMVSTLCELLSSAGCTAG